MTLESQATFEWQQLARRQKIYVFAAIAVVLLIIAGISIDAWQAHSSVHQYEQTAAEAERQKQDALDLAAKTASKIQIAEEQLSKVEVKKDATQKEVKDARDAVARDRAEYDRAVRERLPTVPSTSELCRQLADAGHPCNTR